jgi:hypothetical protein
MAMFHTWVDSAIFAAEMQQVIFLRTLKFMRGGGAAQLEASRMIAEKIDATSSAMIDAALGRSAASIAQSVRRKVRANRRRLLR